MWAAIKAWTKKQPKTTLLLIGVVVFIAVGIAAVAGWKALIAFLGSSGGAGGALGAYLKHIEDKRKADTDDQKIQEKFQTTLVKIDSDLKRKLEDSKSAGELDAVIPAGLSDDAIVNGLNKSARDFRRNESKDQN